MWTYKLFLSYNKKCYIKKWTCMSKTVTAFERNENKNNKEITL